MQLDRAKTMHPPSTLMLVPLASLPEIEAGDDLAGLLAQAVRSAGESLLGGDILVVAQKIVSKAEGRTVALADVQPSPRACEISRICEKDPRLVELVLRESSEVVRCRKDVLIVRHKLGFVVANAAIDQSNVAAGDDRALLLPCDPDASAAALRTSLNAAFGTEIGVVINDSFGRPWRLGTCGTAIGCAGIESLRDLRGKPDRFGRKLLTSELAIGDEIAAAGSLVMGQASEGVPAVIVRGLARFEKHRPAADLLRPVQSDLFT